MSASAFRMFLLLLVMYLAGFGLDQIPRGSAYAFEARNCSASKTNMEMLIPKSGAPCKGMRQDFGWPVHSSSKFTDQKQATKQWVPKNDYQCYHGCGRYNPSYNAAILMIVVFGGIGILRWHDNRQVDKRLLELARHRKRHN